MAATSSYQEQCLRTTSDADDGGNEDSNHSRERVCARQPGNWRVLGGRERALGGGGAGKGKAAWTCGKRERRGVDVACLCVCVCERERERESSFHGFFFFFFFILILQTFFLTFRPDCGFIL